MIYITITVIIVLLLLLVLIYYDRKYIISLESKIYNARKDLYKIDRLKSFEMKTYVVHHDKIGLIKIEANSMEMMDGNALIGNQSFNGFTPLAVIPKGVLITTIKHNIER